MASEEDVKRIGGLSMVGSLRLPQLHAGLSRMGMAGEIERRMQIEKEEAGMMVLGFRKELIDQLRAAAAGHAHTCGAPAFDLLMWLCEMAREWVGKHGDPKALTSAELLREVGWTR